MKLEIERDYQTGDLIAPPFPTVCVGSLTYLTDCVNWQRVVRQELLLCKIKAKCFFEDFLIATNFGETCSNIFMMTNK